MRTFKKSDFLREWKRPMVECACGVTEGEEMLDELVDGDGSPIDGSVPDGSESQIQAGPVQQPKKDKDTSDYVKGIATTTDDVRQKTSQGPDWQAAYGGLGGTYYSHGHRVNTGSWEPWIGNDGITEDLEENMSKMVEKMLTNKDKEDLKVVKVDLDLSKKAQIDDLINKIKNLDQKGKEKLEKLLSDAKS
jgi:hypothetical protein